MILLLTVCVNTLLSISFLTVTVNHKYLQKYVYDIINRTNGTEESMETAVSVDVIPVYIVKNTEDV